MDLYAEWGVDFVKCDDICRMDAQSAKAEIEMLHKAISQCGRDIVLSLSPGPAIVSMADFYKENAEMWRITDDFWDRWELLLNMFERCRNWQEYVMDGSYPDCDMLPLGYLGKGFGDERVTRFTKAEQKTMMNLWCIFRSPLMLGAEINILDYKGTLDLKPEHIKHLDLRIAGIHFQCYKPGSIDENTTAIINAIKNPDIDIISHPDDGHCPLDYEAVVKAAKEYHTLLELNNNALRSSSRLNVAQNQETLMKLSMKYDVPMICGSDAHYMNDIANYTCIEPIIKKVNFPDKLIINYDTKKFEDYINENTKNRLYH